MSSDIFDLDSYDYVLPDSCIAQQPHDPADECKIMIADRSYKGIEHQIFRNAILSLDSDYVLFFNNSKVVRARIPLENAIILYDNASVSGIQGGELFYLGSVGNNAYQFMVKPGSKLKIGTIILLGDKKLTIVDNFDYGRIIQYDGDIFALLDSYGQMPLPPYVEYSQNKESDYQPAVAKEPGSVASPTASLHFTPGLLEELKKRSVCIDYLTLHVGIGTFRPIKTKYIKDFQIHSERCQIDIGIFERIMNYKLAKKEIIAIGTTACRTLESMPYLFALNRDMFVSLLSATVVTFRDRLSDGIGEQNYVSQLAVHKNYVGFACALYITPGFRFRVIDQLITNFHLPKSSLMVLLASFMGYEYMMQAYEQAIKNNYMFYSFGDAMRVK